MFKMGNPCYSRYKASQFGEGRELSVIDFAGDHLLIEAVIS